MIEGQALAHNRWTTCSQGQLKRCCICNKRGKSGRRYMMLLKRNRKVLIMWGDYQHRQVLRLRIPKHMWLCIKCAEGSFISLDIKTADEGTPLVRYAIAVQTARAPSPEAESKSVNPRGRHSSASASERRAKERAFASQHRHR